MAKVRIFICYNHEMSMKILSHQMLKAVELVTYVLNVVFVSAAMNLEKLKLFRHYYVMVKIT